MTFFNYLLSLVCFARQCAYKRKDALALELSKNTDLPSMLSAEERQRLYILSDGIAVEERFLAILEELQKAGIAKDEDGVLDILRDNPALGKALIDAAGSDDWFDSKYVRILRENDDDIMLEGRRDLLKTVYRLRMANK